MRRDESRRVQERTNERTHYYCSSIIIEAEKRLGKQKAKKESEDTHTLRERTEEGKKAETDSDTPGDQGSKQARLCAQLSLATPNNQAATQ